jgi:hypothetical protein
MEGALSMDAYRFDNTPRRQLSSKTRPCAADAPLPARRTERTAGNPASNRTTRPQHDGRHDDEAHQQRWMRGRRREAVTAASTTQSDRPTSSAVGQVATLQAAQRDELGPSQGEDSLRLGARAELLKSRSSSPVSASSRRSLPASAVAMEAATA